MNPEVEAEDRVRERLFDALLEEAVVAEAANAPASRRSWWGLLAALLATLVTVAIAVSGPANRGDEAQDPESFDPLFPRIERRFHRGQLHVQLRTIERVRDLPDGPLPPVAVLPGGPTGDGPPPLDVLDALLLRGGVRSLTIGGDRALPIDRWQAIAELPELDELTICCPFDADCLRVLRHAPMIRALGVSEPRHPLTTAMVDAVLELPHLDCLSLVWLDVERGALERLAGLPNLQSLYVEGCETEPGWIDELARIRTLRWLGLTVGRFDDGTLAADQLRRLSDLPRLESLFLHRVAIAAEDYAALPASLRVLDLGGDLPASALRDLLTRPALRGLDVAKLDAAAHDVLCARLPTTRLERFGVHRHISPPLWEALKQMPRLRHLSFSASEDLAADLAHVVELQFLEHLAIHASVPSAEQLQCLQSLPILRRLVLSAVGDGSAYDADLPALQAAIGSDVDLIVH